MTSKLRAVAKKLLSLILLSANTLAFADGPLDPSFANGYGIYPFPLGLNWAVMNAMSQDSEGHLLTAGRSRSATNTDVMTVTRHDAGVLDSGFGDRGIISGLWGDFDSRANAIAMDHAGRIVVAGTVVLPLTCSGSSTTTYFGVTRLLNGDEVAGQPDTEFGGTPFPGSSLIHVGECSVNVGASGVAIGPNNEVVLVGTTWDGAHYVTTLVRWTKDGTLDSTFGSSGSILASYRDADLFGRAIAIDETGRIVAVAYAVTPSGNIGVIMRFTTAGSADSSFGEGGTSTFSLGAGHYGDLCCVAIDPYGRLVVAGTAEAEIDGDDKIVLARFMSTGILDETFGMNGLSEPAVSAHISQSMSLAIDRQGRAIVAVDHSSNTSFEQSTPLIAHINLDGSLNSASGFGGIYTTSIGFNDSYSTSVVVDDGGRTNVLAYGFDRDGAFPALIRYDELFGDGFD